MLSSEYSGVVEESSKEGKSLEAKEEEGSKETGESSLLHEPSTNSTIPSNIYVFNKAFQALAAIV